MEGSTGWRNGEGPLMAVYCLVVGKSCPRVLLDLDQEKLVQSRIDVDICLAARFQMIQF